MNLRNIQYAEQTRLGDGLDKREKEKDGDVTSQ